MRSLSPRFYSRLLTVWIGLSMGGIVAGALLWKRLNVTLEGTLADATFQRQVDVIYSLLQDAETGQRGYLITQNPSYLVPLRRSEDQFNAQFDALARYAFRDDILRFDVLELRGVAELKLAEIKRTIVARDTGGLAAATKIVSTNEGKLEMDKIREIIMRLSRHPSSLFYELSDATRAAIRRALYTTIGSSLIGLGAGLLAFYLSRVALKQEQDARLLAEEALAAARAVREKS